MEDFLTKFYIDEKEKYTIEDFIKQKDDFIDILTDDEIIEIKNGKNWKHAIGQILVYSNFYPKHKKRLHLFNIVNDELINDFCRKNNISVSYESENIIKNKNGF